MMFKLRNTLLIITVIMLGRMAAWSEPVELLTAEKVAFIRAQNVDIVSPSGLAALSAVEYSVAEMSVIENKETSQPLAYVAQLNPRGFIVTSADDRVTPVIAYSYRENFSFSDTGSNILLKLLKQDMRFRYSAIDIIDKKITEKNKEEWGYYLNFENSDSESDYTALSQTQWPADDATGWLDTTWDQGAPYNNYCPIDPDTNNRSVVGCVATAIAQVINYHQFPPSIRFDEDDSYTTSTRGIDIDDDYVTADFPSFSELNRRLASIDYNDTATYAPLLSFAAGIVVEMNYKSDGSGAYVTREHFVEKLRFSDALVVEYAYYDKIRENIKDAYPVLLGITDEDGDSAHMIVADGYKTKGEYHLNFGWGADEPDAISDCWYSLPEELPSDYSVIRKTYVDLIPGYHGAALADHPVSYPNPFNPAEAKEVIIILPEDEVEDGVGIKEVRIFNLSGELVKKIEGGISARWNGKNDKGKTCASGLYLYAIETQTGDILRGKLTLIK